MDTDTTPVLFRRERGGNIIAIFPTVAERAGMCACYTASEGHSLCDPAATVRQSAPVDPTDRDVMSLRRQLQGPPYNYRLHILSRRPHK